MSCLVVVVLRNAAAQVRLAICHTLLRPCRGRSTHLFERTELCIACTVHEVPPHRQRHRFIVVATSTASASRGVDDKQEGAHSTGSQRARRSR